MSFYEDVMQTYDAASTIDQAAKEFDKRAKEFDKRITYITRLKWHVKLSGIGMGHGTYVVVNYKKKQIILFECPCHEIAQHICDIHNRR